MADKKFDLGDYVEVKDRIRILYELFPQARIETDYHLTSEPDDRPKVIVRALVYRKPEDEKPAGHGTSWLYLPGSTTYTKGSEIENAETSAVGRAIGMLGILIVGGMASRQEVEAKQGESDRPARPAPARLPPREDPATQDPEPSKEPYTETEEMIGRIRRHGTIRKGTSDRYKLAAFIGPEGHAIGFRLEVGPEKHIPQCIVDGPLGEALYLATGEHPDKLIGVGATVSGILYNVRGPKGSWYRLHVDHIETTIDGLEVILPATEPLLQAAYETPADEAPSVPLFSEGDMAALDAELVS